MGGLLPRRLDVGKQAAERRIGGQTARARRDKNPVHESTAAFGGARRLQPQYHAGLEREVSALRRSEEHTSELQSLMRISYAVFCLKKKRKDKKTVYK